MSFSLIRRAARGIKYATIVEFLNREITFSDRLNIVSESTSFVQELFPLSSFIGSEQNVLDGQIAKYGILDLEFSAEQSLLHNCQSGVPILRALGFGGNNLGDEEFELDDDDLFSPMSGIEMVLDDINESCAYLKLFLRSKVDPPFDMRERFLRPENPALLQFPMTFTISDACLTNVESAWIMKHFYL